jgi:REP element-mobilizing transposase RayT
MGKKGCHVDPDFMYRAAFITSSNAAMPVNRSSPTLRTTRSFEQLLATMLARCRARVHAFCWEVDAIHLALQVTDMPVGRLMQRLSSQYARRVHRRQGNGGHLFQQRYHSLLIDPDAYLLKLIRYLHLIPVRSGRCGIRAIMALSSQRAYLGMTADSVADHSVSAADAGAATGAGPLCLPSPHV